MGIYYPEKPSKEYQEKTKTFVEALSLMYPCAHCAEDFQNEVKKSPPKYVTVLINAINCHVCANGNTLLNV